MEVGKQDAGVWGRWVGADEESLAMVKHRGQIAGKVGGRGDGGGVPRYL